ncbi:hypothetical protein ACKI1I_40370 [Streptomyces turgidiscabies]|uniref:C2H2-type domain-containing protein n=1 Tax=Streptomyces turgidiscabies (strain Car8) TaxID=698760 RepID=L7FIC3_STRT8|nr:MULTISPECIES: hypothetical protein [Streptomyces]ELP71072.1 hypothetical protein STRTUCAR8_06578 [Streptomyces turgidiscabies Car8]MDX3493400.1 hypothetical protein [Streptomyces turgidiscabies]GAQ70706.1 hypothetical protein T45_02444 [Streptomyces turgidiscabies]
MSETTGHRSTATAVVHESYSFACMRCGHGWEQSYEIEHHTDTEGGQMVMYVADGRVVPSPLTRPTCQNCDGHVVRIMRAGQVSSVQNSMQRQRTVPRAVPVADEASGTPKEDHHWHLSDLLHPFHRKAS